MRTASARILAYFFQHRIYRRGQTHQLLSTTQVPPQLGEFFLSGNRRWHAKGLRAVGLNGAFWSTSRSQSFAPSNVEH
ncbi:MAG: hypothetical protein GDA41_02615 [Rhodospirillales bacterium]|nr:hypothetical protein [Rhodospirillales bacterium]